MLFKFRRFPQRESNGMSDALFYQLNECRFNLPHADVQDASINILKFAELGTSLIVSRSVLEEGETLRSNFDGQLKRLGQQVEAFRFQLAESGGVGAEQDVEALEIQSQFSRGADQVFQYQLAFLRPGTRQMLALSYVKPQPLSDADAVHWAAIKTSLRLSSV